MRRQTEIEKIAEQRGASFRPRSAANLDADFYTTLPPKPQKEWRAASILSAGADLKPGDYEPCPLKKCSGNGLILLEDTGNGRRTYATCPHLRRSA